MLLPLDRGQRLLRPASEVRRVDGNQYFIRDNIHQCLFSAVIELVTPYCAQK